MAGDIDFTKLIVPVAERLRGKSNQKLSHRDELRWGSSGSFSVVPSKGTWYCNETKQGGGVLDLIKLHGHSDPRAWLKAEGFTDSRVNGKANGAKFKFSGGGTKANSAKKPPLRIKGDFPRLGLPTKVYPYDGSTLEVCRFDPTPKNGLKEKTFRQRQRDGDSYFWTADGAKLVPYRLNELIAAIAAGKPVFFVEGEKDADNMVADLGVCATCNPMGAGKWPEGFSEFFKGADVCISPDNDQPGRDHLELVGSNLIGAAKAVTYIELDVREKGDYSDWRIGQEDIAGAFWKVFETRKPFEPAAPAAADWRDQLKLTHWKNPQPSAANICIELEHDEAWDGVLYFDEFQHLVMLAKPVPVRVDEPVPLSAPRPLKDSDLVAILCWFALGDYPTIGIDKIDLAVRATAERKYSRHPVRSWLNTLQWDGVARIDDWLITFCGAAPANDRQGGFIRAIGAKWLISAVARIYQPGCQVDHVLVLEGPQGTGKSSAFAVLGGEWFTDALPGDLTSKDASDFVAGVWIIELSELSQVRRATVESLKSFITRRVERFRPAYGRFKETYHRQCVFAGSTNESAYLADATGNRRFWPVKVGKIDLLALKAARDQLWAEAVHRYRQGETWWLTDEDLVAAAADEQEARREDDPWFEPIREYLKDKVEIRPSTLLELALNIPVSAQRTGEWNRVTRIMTALGWAKAGRTAKGVVWRPTTLARRKECKL